jgi:hypothetical protein
MQKFHEIRVSGWRRTALALALGASLGGVAMAQSTTGSIFGQAPAATGETVVVSNKSGINREVVVDSAGTFQVRNVPVGTYTVSLKKDGAVVDSRTVTLSPGSGVAVAFSAAPVNTTTLSTVTVSATAIPPIDVTSVNSSTVITAAELKKLPVVRNAESIALLAPGTVSGSGFFAGPGNPNQNLVAFGGSSVSENAYYVNGYNTAEPYKNLGGFQLPYGAIDQQETLTGGYNAKYGRSDGGVINQIGKRGTNQWHFGAQVVWQPRALEGTPTNNRYGNPTLPTSTTGVAYVPETDGLAGTIHQYRNDNKQWETSYSAYLGGPLLEDKLYMFVAAETDKVKSTDVQVAQNQVVAYDTDKATKLYGKLDWNITDNNLLELTMLKNHQTNGAGSTYAFDTPSLTRGEYLTKNDIDKHNAQFYVGHFTSYITDDATLSILYGKGKFQNPTQYAPNPLPFISRPQNQNPAYLPPGTGPFGITNSQTNTAWFSDQATNATHGLRVDFDYRLGDHDLSVGIDNMSYSASHQGQNQQNPDNPDLNYYWRYLSDTVVQKREIGWETSMSTRQKAYYLQDDWQVTSNLLLNIGIRNDHFTNFNDVGKAFVDEKNQWEPRIGASWDVNGDSSFKIYGNVGRYYLALPDNAAERAANASTYLTTRYSYTGVDPDTGVPTGITALGPATSPDGEFGLPKDPEQVTARNLKPEYLDEFIVGFDKKLNEEWVYGAKAMWRDLKSAIDDECSPTSLETKMQKLGMITTTDLFDGDSGYYNSLYGASYCRLINPGQTNTILVKSDDGSTSQLVPMTQEDWGYIQGVKRKTGSLNLYLEHPFDGKWQARIDYTYSRGFGNTEGQVRSDFGQADVSKTEDWDTWQLMDGANGELANVRKHQIRIRGAYQVTPEWLLSATVLAQSGYPKECLGYYGPEGTGDDHYGPGADGDPSGYNNYGSGNYHWCHGDRIAPGDAGHTPWTKQLNFGVHYTPSFADHKLAFNLDVFNAFNEQKAIQTDPAFANGYDPDTNSILVNPAYGDGIYFQPPRMVRLSVSYDY